MPTLVYVSDSDEDIDAPSGISEKSLTPKIRKNVYALSRSPRDSPMGIQQLEREGYSDGNNHNGMSVTVTPQQIHIVMPNSTQNDVPKAQVSKLSDIQYNHDLDTDSLPCLGNI